MAGFCGDKCPIPKVISDIKSGSADFCQKGLLAHEDVREATAALMQAIISKGECDGKPDVSPYSETEDWVSCASSYHTEIDCLGDALEINGAGVVLNSRVVEHVEEVDKEVSRG